MSAIYILWLRELKRYIRSRAQIIGSLGQPLLYLLVLGFGLGPVFQKSGNGSYIQFVAPGVVGMSILFILGWIAGLLIAAMLSFGNSQGRSNMFKTVFFPKLVLIVIRHFFKSSIIDSPKEFFHFPGWLK